MNLVKGSNFCEHMNAFIAQKRALGFCYRQEAYILQEIADFAVKNFPEEKYLSKQLLLTFAVRKDNQSPKTLLAKISIARSFAKYLLSIGENAYVLPHGLVRKDPQMTPHIYEVSEISMIWNKIDRLMPQNQSPTRHLVFPVLFRILYCCGLRPNEALSLKPSDVNLSNGQIFINESKDHISRNIVMSDDLTEFCRNYDSKISAIMPERKLFFPNKLDEKWCYTGLCSYFRNMISEIGIISRGDRTPRMYDFRHTFATHRLYLWMKEGKNIADMIPYLSAYMGHADPSTTFYYIHLVPGQFENLSGKSFSDQQNLLPEVPSL
jgi:integrase